MTGQRVLAVALLVTSLFVLGTLSASLGTTVTSTPNDAIDVEKESLPFVGDGASKIANSYESAENGPTRSDVSSNDRSGSTSGGDARQGDSSSGGGDDGRMGGASGQSDGNEANNGGQSNGESNSVSSGQRESGQGSGSSAERSLWALLWQLLSALLSLLSLLAVLAAGVVVARHRDRLMARLRAFADRFGLLSSNTAGSSVGVPDGDGDPETVVERAWSEMVRTSPVAMPASETPRECARAVVDAGGDPGPVEELTDMYERVRYGERPITPEDASRALAALRTVRPDGAMTGTSVPGRQSAAAALGEDRS